MLIDVLIFVAGFALGGLFVFRGMRTAIKRELSKPPLSEEEQDERARQLLAKARPPPLARRTERMSVLFSDSFLK